MRSANRPSTSLRKAGASSHWLKTGGGISNSVLGRVATPLAESGWLRNRQALETRHSSPGTTRYSSSERPSPEWRETLTSPSRTSGKPRHGAFSLNSSVPAGTWIGAMPLPGASGCGLQCARAGYRSA